MTRQDIQIQMAETIKKETGATVEVTLVSDTRLSVLAESQAALDTAMGIMQQVPSVTLESVESYADEDMFAAFYSY